MPRRLLQSSSRTRRPEVAAATAQEEEAASRSYSGSNFGVSLQEAASSPRRTRPASRAWAWDTSPQDKRDASAHRPLALGQRADLAASQQWQTPQAEDKSGGWARWTSNDGVELRPEEEKLKEKPYMLSESSLERDKIGYDTKEPDRRKGKDKIPRRIDYGDRKCWSCARWYNPKNHRVCSNCGALPDDREPSKSSQEYPLITNFVLRRLGSWNCACTLSNFWHSRACHHCGKSRNLSKVQAQLANMEDGNVSLDPSLGDREDKLGTVWQWKHLRRRMNTSDSAQEQKEHNIKGFANNDSISGFKEDLLAKEREERLTRSASGEFVAFQAAGNSAKPTEEQEQINELPSGTPRRWNNGPSSQRDQSDIETIQPRDSRRRYETNSRPLRLTRYASGAEEQPLARSITGLENAPDRNRMKERYRAQRSARQFDEEYEEADEATVARIERKRQRKKERLEGNSSSPPTPVILPEFISVENLATVLRVRVEEFSARMKSLGFDETSNDHVLDAETAGLIASEFNFEPIVPEKASETEDLIAVLPAEDKTFLLQRPPVITIMGHVDHGKTTLLDWLRKSSVAASEHGGITQHIGAFTVPMPSGRIITFLDTPGHAAFLSMRQRGANVTDIVILVVAADDSVKPQTIEAIKHARAAGVPMIVAVNKIDKTEADVERVKQDLSRHGVEIEDYGGDTQVVCVSGKTGKGMEELEDSAVALADVLDMRAEIDGQAEGWVLEATTRKSGRAATVLVRRGTIVPGLVIVAGSTWARVRSLRNEAGAQITSAGPGTPVEIDGWREQPEAGDEVLQAPDEQRAKAVVQLRRARAEKEKMVVDVIAVNEARKMEQEKREREEEASSNPTPDRKRNVPQESAGLVEVPFIIRADVSGSVEAVVDSISSLGNSRVRPTILRSAVGPIAPTDVEHAAVAQGHIVSFNTPVDGTVRRMAKATGVSILDQNIIYRLTDDVKTKLEEAMPPTITLKVLGEAEIAEVFDINVKGRATVPVAGCRIRNGVIRKGTSVRLLRFGEVLYTGTFVPSTITLIPIQH